MSPFVLRVLAALFIIDAGVLFFATAYTKAFATPLILGNLRGAPFSRGDAELAQ